MPLLHRRRESQAKHAFAPRRRGGTENGPVEGKVARASNSIGNFTQGFTQLQRILEMLVENETAVLIAPCPLRLWVRERGAAVGYVNVDLGTKLFFSRPMVRQLMRCSIQPCFTPRPRRDSSLSGERERPRGSRNPFSSGAKIVPQC